MGVKRVEEVEVEAVSAGTGVTRQVLIGAETFDVGPGAVVLIPAGAPHDYRVVGEEAFAFLCLVPNTPEDVVSIVEDDDAAPGGC